MILLATMLHPTSTPTPRPITRVRVSLGETVIGAIARDGEGRMGWETARVGLPIGDAREILAETPGSLEART